MLRALRENARLSAFIFAVALLLPALLAERLAIPVRYVPSDHSARQLVTLRLLYLIPILTGALSVLMTPQTFARVLRIRFAFVGLACIAIDVAVYAAAGVLERSFKATLAFPLAASASVGAALTGIMVFRFAPVAVDYLVAAATSISAVVGGFQMAEALGRHTAIGAAIVRWDQVTARTFHTEIAWMKAEGFAQNPNMYTPFAIVGFIWALFGTPRPAARWVILISSLAVALLGASQTTFVILGVLVALFVLREAARRMSPAAARRLIWAVVVVAVIGGVVATAAVVDRSAQLARAGAATDLAAGDAVATDGLESRIVVWNIAIRAAQDNPWGTFGRTIDRLAPYTHAHNEVLQRLLYAGPLWPLVHLVFLGWVLLWLRPRSMPWIGTAIALALLLNGITEPLYKMHPYTVLLYLIIGCAMWQMASEDDTPTVADEA